MDVIVDVDSWECSTFVPPLLVVVSWYHGGAWFVVARYGRKCVVVLAEVGDVDSSGELKVLSIMLLSMLLLLLMLLLMLVLFSKFLLLK